MLHLQKDKEIIMSINSSIVASLASGIQRKSAYRGNAQIIPVDVSTSGGESSTEIILSDVLPENSFVYDVKLAVSALGSGGKLNIGVTGDTDAIIDDKSVATATDFGYHGVPVETSGLQIIGDVTSTDAGTIKGFIGIITDE